MTESMTSSSTVVVKALRKLGYACLESNRGLQVKQRMRCLTHKTTFLGYPNFIMKGSYVFACEECGKIHIDNNDAKGINYWVFPKLLAYALSKHRRFEHTLVSINTSEKTVTLKCETSGTVFTTKRILAEFRQGRTDCPHCAVAMEDARQYKAATANANRQNRKNTNRNYTYTAAGKHCVKHGLLTQGRRCLICHPKKYTPTKWQSSEVAEQLTTLAKKHGFRIKKQEGGTNPAFNLLVCKKHQTVVKARHPKSWKSLHWASCIDCATENAIQTLKTRYPSIEIASCTHVTGRAGRGYATWRVQLVSGAVLTYNSRTGTLRSKRKSQKEELRSYITKEYHMATALTVVQSLNRITDKFPDITILAHKQVKGSSASAVKVKLEHTCGHIWVTTANKVIQTRYGCPACARKAQAVNISKALAPLEDLKAKLKTTSPTLSVRGRRKCSGNSAYSFKWKIFCTVCQETFYVWPDAARRLRGCLHCKTDSVSGRGGRSPIANNWLGELEGLYGITIKGYNSPEVSLRVADKVYRVDGFNAETNTVFEFLGDYWHGNPDTFPDKPTSYETTIKRLTHLSSKFNVVYVWESDYKLTGLPHSGLLGRGVISFLTERQDARRQ